LPRVYKAATVFIDHENKVQIKSEVKKPAMPGLVDLSKNSELSDTEKLDDFKPNEPPAIPPEVIAFNIKKEAEGEARVIRTQAQAEAQGITDRAKMEADILMRECQLSVEESRTALEEESKQLRETCKQEGYDEGYSVGAKAGEALKVEAQAVLDEAKRTREEILQSIEPDTVDLVVRIVGKLLNDAVTINPAIVVSLIRQGLSDATLSGKVTVRVSEEDYPEVIACKDMILTAVGSSAELEILSDLSLKTADCLIETPYGVIDCSLTPQYEALCENLTYLLRQELDAR